MTKAKIVGPWLATAIAGLVAAQVVGCAAQTGTESTGSEGDAIKNCPQGVCDPPDPTDPPTKPPKQPPPPPPPPPPTTCTWNPLTTYTARCQAPFNETVYVDCPTTTDTSPLANAQRYLMAQGCSSPVYWYTVNPIDSNDWANAQVQMCPRSLEGYVDSLGMFAGADHPSHHNETYCDSKLPPPPADYFWAVPWMDPNCHTGCMCQGM